MSQRDMWKMLHLLNNTARPGLTTKELADAGVDCYQDTLMELEVRRAVVRARRDNDEFWSLTDAARGVLNTCTVAHKADGAREVQVDRSRAFCVMPFSEAWSND